MQMMNKFESLGKIHHTKRKVQNLFSLKKKLDPGINSLIAISDKNQTQERSHSNELWN